MSSINCPNCGSEDVKSLSEVNTRQLTLGREFEYESVLHECNTCGEKGDFTGDGDTKYLVALKDAQKALQKSLIDDLGKMGFTMAYIERALELPQRTLARWKNGDLSAANLALLRIIRTMPWILNVADHNFNQQYITSKMFSIIAEKLSQGIQSSGYSPTGYADFTNPDSLKVMFSIDRESAINTNELITNSSQVKIAAGGT